MVHAGERPNIFDPVLRLVLDRALRPFGDNEMRFNVALPECLKQANAEDGAGRAGQTYNQTPRHAFFL
jgi:hypothetical protein